LLIIHPPLRHAATLHENNHFQDDNSILIGIYFNNYVNFTKKNAGFLAEEILRYNGRVKGD
jgi:hypothetical protein